MPDATPVNNPDVFVYVDPLVLNVNPISVELTVIVPVATLHVGCVTVAVGVPGTAG